MEWPWRRRETDLERELRADLELEEAEQRERGLSAEEARYAARRALGNAALVGEDVRAAWGWTWVASVAQDLRFGARILAKSPGLSAAVVLSLALGLGATTALFSLLNSLLWKPLPVPEADRLVVLRHGAPGKEDDPTFPYPQFAMLREEAKSAVDLFAVSGGINRLQADGIDRKVATQFVSGDYFRILRVLPALGRLLEPEDGRLGSESAATAVLSYRFWQSAFHGDPGVAGRKVRVDGVPFTIAGVAPRGFFGVEVGSYPDVSMPFAAKPALSPQYQMLECKGCYWLDVMGRLRPGMQRETAQAGLGVVWSHVRRETINQNLAERYRASYYAERLAVNAGAGGTSELRLRFTKPLYVLLAMAAVILLISCSNISNLLTARALARQKELAVRLSIGARRGRLVRQLLTESALLAAAGLACAIAVYWFTMKGLVGFMRYYLDTSPDWRMAWFAAGLAVITLCLFGLTPALRATRWRLSGTLAEGSQTVSARTSVGRAAVCGQLALSFALLAAAILLSRSLYDLRTFPAGFRRDHLLLVEPDTDNIGKGAPQVRYIENLLAEVRRLPGVRSASASVVVPMSGSSWGGDYTTSGYAAQKTSDYRCYVNYVSPDFPRTMGTRLVAGRDFTDADDAAATKVALVNEGFARRYWRNQNPLGRQFHAVDEQEQITVVGVVEDARYRDFRTEEPPALYVPLRQMDPRKGSSPRLEAWTWSDPHALVNVVREITRQQGADVPVTFQSFEEMIDGRILYERLLAALSVAFGGLGLLICAVGIYGVAAYSVNRRTAEIGVRMALGATPGAVMRMLLGEQMVLVAIGLAVGTAGALVATRFLRTWLFGVSPTDAISLAAAVALLAAIAGLATSIPARRAAGIEPVRALRQG